jgi:hypothetical protein
MVSRPIWSHIPNGPIDILNIPIQLRSTSSRRQFADRERNQRPLAFVGIEISAMPAAISLPKSFRIDIHADQFRMGKTPPRPCFPPLLSRRMEQTGIRIGALIRAEK